MPLLGYGIPNESELLAEAGLVQGAETDAALSQAARWTARTLSPAERTEIANRCQNLLGESFRAFKVTEKNLACVPWAMEKDVLSKGRKERTERKIEPKASLRSEEAWRGLQGIAFQEAFQRVDPIQPADLERLVGFAKATSQDCSFRGAVAALIARAESFLPDDVAFNAIDALYPSAFACLEPDDDGFERTHLRVGLLRLMRGDSEKAKQSLLLAAHSEDPQEEFRALFWLGVIAQNGNEGGDRGEPGEYAADLLKNSWKTLRRKYPITIHSVLASHSQGVDPIGDLGDGNDITIVRRVGEGWTAFNTAGFLLELLAARGEATAMFQWSEFISRHVDAPNSDSKLFLAFLHNAAQNYRASFALLSRYFNEKQHDGLSIDTLNLAFPRPFHEEILGATQNVDPVLVFALIRQESAFNPAARSVADARGLMQLLPSTARKYLAHPQRELYIPASNVQAGVSYMQELLRKYDGKVEHMLAAYNAGWKNLERWKTRFPNVNTLLFSDLIPFRETRTYVAIILRNAYWYGRLMSLNDDALARTMIKKSAASKWRSQTVHKLLEVAWDRNDSKNAVASLNGLYTLGSGSGAATRARLVRDTSDTLAVTSKPSAGSTSAPAPDDAAVSRTEDGDEDEDGKE